MNQDKYADGDFRDGVLHHAGMVLYRDVSVEIKAKHQRLSSTRKV
jgi:hypothetical protein